MVSQSQTLWRTLQNTYFIICLWLKKISYNSSTKMMSIKWACSETNYMKVYRIYIKDGHGNRHPVLKPHVWHLVVTILVFLNQKRPQNEEESGRTERWIWESQLLLTCQSRKNHLIKNLLNYGIISKTTSSMLIRRREFH